jgi:hypothetical protein
MLITLKPRQTYSVGFKHEVIAFIERPYETVYYLELVKGNIWSWSKAILSTYWQMKLLIFVGRK